jgi:(1->4)-alpha-D-glucan 1-alpha-D-glucosylmutase
MAREILPYVRNLGVSHVYASPIQKARKGSTHGYDIVDPREINPELGGRDAFNAFSDVLHAHDLKLIVDIVPNHMGIGPENPFWSSVLQWGEASPHAPVFDIDFKRGGGKVLLPVLGKPYDEALASGEIQLGFDPQQGFTIRFFSRAFPVAPRSCLRLLGQFDDRLAADPLLYEAEWKRLVQTSTPEDIAALCQSITSDHDALDAILREQSYRLAHWRLASTEINYRRFFEINALAGVRIEDEHVFAMTHELVFALVEEGRIDGLRIDHIDGLADPKTYLERLQRRVGPGFYIIAEKILERGEKLKAWPIAGTTGYDALNELDGILVAREAEAQLAAFYRKKVGETKNYADALDEAKLLVVERSFGAECDRITAGLYQLARKAESAQDISEASLRRVLKQAVVALPVYRTYVGAQGADAADRELIASDLARVRAAADAADLPAAYFLESVLAGELQAEEARALRCAFEQLTGPVMAKGLEDTLFYRHAPFLALNEVGADPSGFGYTREAFDEASRVRAQDWPASLIATATHDTKRGEDARARLLAMTAEPEFFLEQAESFLAHADGPDRNDAFILFQALAAAWPVVGAPAPDFGDRARGFFQKAMREAKRHSSWTDPDEDYEARALRLVDRCFETPRLRDPLQKLAHRFAWPGALNGLARTILKLTLPGVPDFYQGTELWDFAFVDPDNRRPVDFELRTQALGECHAYAPLSLLEEWQDGRIKQWLISRLLAHRAEDPELFAYADYEPRDCVNGISFERRYRERAIFVCVHTGTQMLKRGLLNPQGVMSSKDIWGSEKLTLSSGQWRNLLTGSAFAVEGAVACADVAGGLPWLILGKIA